MLKAEQIERSNDLPAELRTDGLCDVPVRSRAAELRSKPREMPPIAPAEPEQRSDAATIAVRPTRRQRVRWALFALLPIAAAAGAYWYVTGGRIMSTDDAYVEADKVGISTDVSGIRFFTGSTRCNSKLHSTMRRPIWRRRRSRSKP
jgi:membrane fusion protein (multidrug efflux system)